MDQADETVTRVILETPRLVLKSVTPELIHHVYSTKSKQEVIDFFGFDEQGYQHYKKMHEKGMVTHRLSLLFFAIEIKDTGEIIGECGFHTWNHSHHRAELFYMIRNDDHKQKGYTTEAVEAVLDYGFNQMNLNRIEAYVAEWNTASVKLLFRQNFKKEGCLRGHYFTNGKFEDSDCYALLKAEWR